MPEMKMVTGAFHYFLSTVDAKVQSDLAKFATILVLVLVLVLQTSGMTISNAGL